MILNAIAEKLKRQSKDDFKGRHFESWLILQAVAWYLRYPLSYRDLEEMFRERGFTAKRDLDAAKRFFRKMLKDEPLLSPGKIGTDGASTSPQRSRRQSTMGTCIRIRFTMLPSISSKALRATIFA